MTKYTLRLEWADGRPSGGTKFHNLRDARRWAKRYREVGLITRVVILKDGVEMEG